MRSLEGHLLIASPHIGDARFERTVVLLLHHDPEGAFGVILNRPLPETVDGLWRKLGHDGCENEQPVNLGGPVSGPLIALHGIKSLAEFEIPPGLYVAEHRKTIERLLKKSAPNLRIFVGHSGWTSGQLESEIDSGSWFIMPADKDHIFGAQEDLWVSAVREKGRRFLSDALGIFDFPEDPSMN